MAGDDGEITGGRTVSGAFFARADKSALSQSGESRVSSFNSQCKRAHNSKQCRIQPESGYV